MPAATEKFWSEGKGRKPGSAEKGQFNLPPKMFWATVARKVPPAKPDPPGATRLKPRPELE